MKHKKEKKLIISEFKVAQNRYWHRIAANWVRDEYMLNEYREYAVDANAVDEIKQIDMVIKKLNILISFGLKKTEGK